MPNSSTSNQSFLVDQSLASPIVHLQISWVKNMFVIIIVLSELNAFIQYFFLSYGVASHEEELRTLTNIHFAQTRCSMSKLREI